MHYAIVKPKDGRRVKDPRDMQPLPETGRRVLVDRYWRRRLADGDVTIVDAKAPKPDATAKEGSKK